MSFDSLKKNRGNRLDELKKNLEEATKGGFTDPDAGQYWQPTVDSAGNGYAMIRYLPEPEGEKIPYQKLYTHSFQDPVTNMWYIENCLTTIGLQDPVVDANDVLWKSGDEEKKKTASRQKRKLYYVVNILVLEDPAKPEHEGNVYKYKIGKKLFEKLNDMMNPQYPGETPVNPFDFWEGANFRIKIAKKDGYRNYDKSSFDSPSALFDGDEDRLRTIYEKLYSLTEVVDPKNFKSYEDLDAKYKRVVGITKGGGAGGATRRAEDVGSTGFSGTGDTSKARQSREQKEEVAPAKESAPIQEKVADKVNLADDSESGGEDDDLAFFAKMASK